MSTIKGQMKVDSERVIKSNYGQACRHFTVELYSMERLF